VVVDVMCKRDGWALEEPLCAALREGVMREPRSGSVPIRFNVYHLLGLWYAPATRRG
jgi:hypothetical protein